MLIPQSAFIRRNPVVRETLRYLLTSIPRHRQGSQRDILLLSSRRSGSTWVMQSLGAEPGLRTLNEPFGPKFVARSYLARFSELGDIYRGHRLFAFPPSLVPRVDEYMDDWRHTALSGPYNPLHPSYHFRTNRRLFKVIHANPAIEYFLDRAGKYHTFVLIRHPCPTVLSMSRKYRCELDLILANEAFCAAQLDDRQFQFLQDLDRHGSDLERFTAEWALEQLVPCRLLPRYRDRCRVVSYEELRLDPAAGFAWLAAYCQLSDLQAILKATDLPSASTADDRLHQVKRSPAAAGLESWRRDIDRDAETAIFRIIDRLGVDYYRPGSLLPSEPYQGGFLAPAG